MIYPEKNKDLLEEIDCLLTGLCVILFSRSISAEYIDSTFMHIYDFARKHDFYFYFHVVPTTSSSNKVILTKDIIKNIYMLKLIRKAALMHGPLFIYPWTMSRIKQKYNQKFNP